jgi:hypothetical protein
MERGAVLFSTTLFSKEIPVLVDEANLVVNTGEHHEF